MVRMQEYRGLHVYDSRAEGDMTKFDPYVAAGPLNAVISGLTVFAAGRWWRQR